MKMKRKMIMAGASLLLAGGATVAATSQADAAASISGIYPDQATCEQAGMDKYGPQDWLLRTNVWVCTYNPGPDGGIMLYYEDSGPGVYTTD